MLNIPNATVAPTSKEVPFEVEEYDKADEPRRQGHGGFLDAGCGRRILGTVILRQKMQGLEHDKNRDVERNVIKKQGKARKERARQ